MLQFDKVILETSDLSLCHIYISPYLGVNGNTHTSSMCMKRALAIHLKNVADASLNNARGDRAFVYVCVRVMAPERMLAFRM